MTSLSRFSTPRQHHCKLMSIHATEKIHSISICEPRMPKIYRAKKLAFGNLDSLTNHHIKGSRPSTFSTLNQQNKDSSTLRRPLVASHIEVVDLNNPIEVKGNSSDGKTKLATWSRFKNPITQLTHHIVALIWQLDPCRWNPWCNPCFWNMNPTSKQPCCGLFPKKKILQNLEKDTIH